MHNTISYLLVPILVPNSYTSIISLINWELENDKDIEDVLAAKGKQQAELINGLLEDEKYQREAFTALFLKQDSRNKEITEHVEQIQQELASLSMVEMTKKSLKVGIFYI